MDLTSAVPPKFIENLQYLIFLLTQGHANYSNDKLYVQVICSKGDNK